MTRSICERIQERKTSTIVEEETVETGHSNIGIFTGLKPGENERLITLQLIRTGAFHSTSLSLNNEGLCFWTEPFEAFTCKDFASS